MRSIEWLRVTLNRLKPPQFLHFALPYAFVNVKDFKYDVQIECASHSLRTTNRPL